MAAHIQLTVAKSLSKIAKKVTPSIQMLMTIPIGHAYVTAVMMETSFLEFSVVKKQLNVEQVKMRKKHFATSQLPKTECLQTLFFNF